MFPQAKNAEPESQQVPAPVIPSPYAQGGDALPSPSNATIIKQRHYGRVEMLYAWLSLAAGYLYIRWSPVFIKPMAGFLLVALFYALTAVYLWKKGARFRPSLLILPGSALIFSAAYFLTANPAVYALVFLWAQYTLIWFAAASMGNTQEEFPGEAFVFDAVKAVFVQPFSRLLSLFPALIPAGGEKKSLRRSAGWVLLGLCLAVIPCVIISGLLSYDERFHALLQHLQESVFGDMLEELGYLALGIPVALYFFGLLVANADRDNAQVLSRETTGKSLENMRAAPIPMVAAVLIPILALYGVFFFSQWDLYLSAFTHTLPDGMQSYAEYARNGFFELCAVALINGMILLAVYMFTERKDGRIRGIQRVFTALYCLATLLLLATALRKMFLYIENYGLTPLRVYTSWIMGLMAVGFLLTLLSVWATKVRLVSAVLVAGLVFFSAVCFVNTDQRIARYNVDAYLKGHLPACDISAMYDLGPSAAPEVLRLLQSGALDGASAEKAHEYLYSQDVTMTDNAQSWLAWTPALRDAREAIQTWKAQYPAEYAQAERQLGNTQDE